ncbi:MAG: diguanylate cyclase [Oleiphilaceae bacterium]|nr:diguanylate cyclase [Oleiphilaceae bacterium]
MLVLSLTSLPVASTLLLGFPVTPYWPWLLLTGLALGGWSLWLLHQRQAFRRLADRHRTELETTRKELEGALHRLEQVATNVPGVVFSFTGDPHSQQYRFPFISERVQSLFEVPPDILLESANPLIERFHPEDLADYLAGVADAMLHQREWQHQARLRTSTGEYRWFEAQSQPLQQEDGQILWYGYFTDIQRHKETEAALRASENRFRSLVENANDIIYTLDEELRIQYASSNFERLLGMAPEKARGRSIQEFLHPNDLPDCQAFILQVFRTGERQSGVEYRVRHRNGQWHWHTSNASLVDNPLTGRPEYLGISRDITQQHQSRQEALYQAGFQKLVARLYSGFSRSDARDMQASVERALTQVGLFFKVGRTYIHQFSRDRSEVVCQYLWCRQGLPPISKEYQSIQLQTLPWAREKMEQLALEEAPLFVEDVRQLPEEASAERALLEEEGVRSFFCVPLKPGGQVTGFLGMDAMEKRQWRDDQVELLQVVANIFSDALEKQRLARDLFRLSVTDPLTGLYNRRHLMERMQAMAAEYDRFGQPCSLLLLDLDHFKALNDSHGHAMGDYTLQCFAGILQSNIRPSDVAARYGGEEFIVLLSNTDKEQATQMAARLLQSTRDSAIAFNGQEHRITSSVGVACITEIPDWGNPDQLLNLADQRLYKAKKTGRDQVGA